MPTQSPQMVYRRFGRTELAMPVLSCGGMRYQQAWEDLEPDAISKESQDNLEATIHRSLEAGIYHIETARGYGCSERQLGWVLPKVPRDELLVQTKVPPKENAAEFIETFNTCMERLQLDYVDLLGIHGINNADLVEQTLKKDGALTAARQLQKEGRVKYIGFSTHGLLKDILTIINSGEFDYVNLHWYYFDQINAPAIDAAKAHDMGVFIISPSDKGGKLYEPSEKLVEFCKPYTPMGLNDLFCLTRDGVDTISLGAARPSDFDEHLAIIPKLAAGRAGIQEAIQRLDDEQRAQLGDDWFANWHVGLPDWPEIPGDVNVYHALRLYNAWKSFDMIEYGRMRYNLLGSGGHWFPGAKVSAMDWQALPQTIAGLPVGDQIPDALKAAHGAFDAEQAARLSES